MLHEETERLVAMVNEGLSDGEIAMALNITHNAVIGRRWRLGLAPGALAPHGPAPTPVSLPPVAAMPAPSASPSRTGKGRAPRQFSRTAPKSAPLSAKLLAAFIAPAVNELLHEWPPVDILGLTTMTCRWPLGDNPADPGFQYCGAPKSIGPYCSVHGLAAYTPRGVDKARRDAAREARL